ncbi:MAG: hypothetical protein E6614_37365, partial [Bradyrhizobium sp.]|nr:hypothetical protein [Bradyrhizobium sp.]
MGSEMRGSETTGSETNSGSWVIVASFDQICAAESRRLALDRAGAAFCCAGAGSLRSSCVADEPLELVLRN